MKKLTFYGRRIVRWMSDNGHYVYSWSGQWVGHAYGHERGTPRQIKNAKPNLDNIRLRFAGSSDKIFWNHTGLQAGDLVEYESSWINELSFTI